MEKGIYAQCYKCIRQMTDKISSTAPCHCFIVKRETKSSVWSWILLTEWKWETMPLQRVSWFSNVENRVISWDGSLHCFSRSSMFQLHKYLGNTIKDSLLSDHFSWHNRRYCFPYVCNNHTNSPPLQIDYNVQFKSRVPRKKIFFLYITMRN